MSIRLTFQALLQGAVEGTTYDVGVLTVVTGLARVRDGAENANAVFAELGNLGDIRVTQTKMPEFCLRQHARVQRSLF